MKGKKLWLVGSICRFPWCKFPIRAKFKVPNITSLNTASATCSSIGLRKGQVTATASLPGSCFLQTELDWKISLHSYTKYDEGRSKKWVRRQPVIRQTQYELPLMDPSVCLTRIISTSPDQLSLSPRKAVLQSRQRSRKKLGTIRRRICLLKACDSKLGVKHKSFMDKIKAMASCEENRLDFELKSMFWSCSLFFY